jgi:hypothetical protein
MSRYYDIIQQLIACVRGIVPQDSPDLPFMCAEDGQGSILASDDWLYDPARRTREFDVRGEGGTRPGEGCNLITDVMIRVVYRTAGANPGFLDCMIQADAQSISAALLFPAMWASADSVNWPVGAPLTYEPVPDPNGAPCNVIVSIPLVVSYRRKI